MFNNCAPNLFFTALVLSFPGWFSTTSTAGHPGLLQHRSADQQRPGREAPRSGEPGETTADHGRPAHYERAGQGHGYPPTRPPIQRRRLSGTVVRCVGEFRPERGPRVPGADVEAGVRDTSSSRDTAADSSGANLRVFDRGKQGRAQRAFSRDLFSSRRPDVA